MSFATFLWLLPLSATAAVLALGAARALDRRRPPMTPVSLFGDAPAGVVFLFDGQRLVDATDRARALLGNGWAGAGAWARLVAHLSADFPDLEEAIATLPERGRLRLNGRGGDSLSLLAEWRGGLRRITLAEPHTETETILPDAMSLRAQEQELEALRRTADAAPLAICRQAADGRILWANSAYMDLVVRQHGAEAALSWPVPVLFADVPRDGRMRVKLDLAAPAADDADLPGSNARNVASAPSLATMQPQGFAEPPSGFAHAPAEAPTPETLWFDCRSVPVEEGRILFATPADATVRAEASLHNFLLTLARTFAHLPIGLAIFDQQRRLQMFNPALTDLTRLPVTFLSARPSLFAVMDAMREGGMLPEPRDYKAWRRQIAGLESGQAADLQETWMLPDGTSYRFTARPQAEGALALLIEDITDEMARARRHHAHLELGQSVIDTLDEAIVVFDTSGAVVMANDALHALWSTTAEASLLAPGLETMVADWQAQSAQTTFWQDLVNFAATPGQRTPWRSEVRLTDGRKIACRIEPVSGQATLVAFRLDQDGVAEAPHTGLRRASGAAGQPGLVAVPTPQPSPG